MPKNQFLLLTACMYVCGWSSEQRGESYPKSGYLEGYFVYLFPNPAITSDMVNGLPCSLLPQRAAAAPLLVNSGADPYLGDDQPMSLFF